jgi:hypothetical protein
VWTHIRLTTHLLLLGIVDLAVVGHTGRVLLRNGPSALLLFAFEVRGRSLPPALSLSLTRRSISCCSSCSWARSGSTWCSLRCGWSAASGAATCCSSASWPRTLRSCACTWRSLPWSRASTGCRCTSSTTCTARSPPSASAWPPLSPTAASSPTLTSCACCCPAGACAL